MMPADASKLRPAAPLHAVGHAHGQREAPEPAPRALDSGELLQGGRSIDILHNGAVYRLQATRLGKLILTK